MDAHLIDGNYEIQYTPWFWSVKQVINAYELCLFVLAHERVFAKPTHQLPGQTKLMAYLECALVLKKCEYLNCENHALITLSSWQLEEPDGRTEKWLTIRTKQWWWPLVYGDHWHQYNTVPPGGETDDGPQLRCQAPTQKQWKMVMRKLQNYVQWLKNARCLSLRHRHLLSRTVGTTECAFRYPVPGTTSYSLQWA